MKAMLLELKTMFDNQLNIQWSKCPKNYLEGGKLSYEVFALNPKMRYEVFTKMNFDTFFKDMQLVWLLEDELHLILHIYQKK